MITTTVLVMCDYDDCPAEFEVTRDRLPDHLPATVSKQLRHRGWSGSSSTSLVHCPLHRRKPRAGP